MSLPTSTAELQRCLADPIWRLTHLYCIVDKRGNKTKFTPNPAQLRFLKEYWYNNVILKARQMGFSTLIQLIMLDACIFVPGTQAAVIAHDLKSARKIFRRVIKYAYDNLPPAIKATVKPTSNSTTELTFTNGSSISVTTSARSDVLHYLHLSELGKIAAQNPQRAYEIMTGSLPTVAKGGYVFVESTAEGREGYFYDLCNSAQERCEMPEPLSQDDYRFHFFAWHDHPAYRRSKSTLEISDADTKYFAEVEAHTGKTIDMPQRRWYVLKRLKQFGGETDAMRREYPSWPEEAFLLSKSGCFYEIQLAAARASNRITSVPHDPRYPVDTWWDLGGDGTPVVYTQRINRMTHVIDYQETFGQPYTEDVRQLLEHTSYRWGTHYLPHDGINKPKAAQANLSAMEQLYALGLRNIQIVPRVERVIDGIQEMRRRFVELRIDKTKCALLVDHLTKYKKIWSPGLAAFTDVPRHDVHSHGSDALRQWAQWPVDDTPNLHIKQRVGS